MIISKILRGVWIPAIACSWFLLAGLAFVPLLGMEDDEALFGIVFYEPRGGVYLYHLGHSHIPLMILSYLGTLKSWIDEPIYRVFGTGIGPTRTPSVLLGAASVWLFYRLLERIAGRLAAAIGCVLLATDAVYLLTSTFDWGPVAVQHVLVLGGALLLLRFWRQRDVRALAGGFFLFGLALWDKALAIWMLSGMAVAALAVVPKQLAQVLTLRHVGVAALWLCVGASPLILYNIHTRGGTLHGNAVYDPAGVPAKARVLVDTIRGSGLMGYFSPEDWQTPQPHLPRGMLQQGAAALASAAGRPRQSFQLYGFLLALLLVPLARGAALRALIFFMVTFAVAWLQMAITAHTGTGLHHTVLLWPLPQAIMAVSFAAAGRRLGAAGIPAVAAVTVVLMASGLLLVNSYFVRMLRNGGTVTWTDAIFPLVDYLRKTTAAKIYCMDWGFLDQARLLSNGQLPVRVGEDPIQKPELSAGDRDELLDMVSGPGHVFVTHPKPLEFFPGLTDKLARFAAAAGYRAEPLEEISDSYGRPTFEVFRFVPQAGGQGAAQKAVPNPARHSF
ncbi:MAG TPA: glycosyltransferase family 39 protein [Bryobacteraceae bacterium]|nr:glycosyltransferase family 39 protein [Bryobacteraceae bacterium]